MKAQWLYLLYVLKHKWYVYQAGKVLAVPFWRLLIHDLSKFGADEWFPYVDYFYGGGKESGSPYKKAVFEVAWQHHWRNNKHHPEYWAKGKTLSQASVPMPLDYVREMVADWYGAGKTQGSTDCWTWYLQNWHNYPIQHNSRLTVEACLTTLEAVKMIPPRDGRV